MTPFSPRPLTFNGGLPHPSFSNRAPAGLSRSMRKFRGKAFFVLLFFIIGSLLLWPKQRRNVDKGRAWLSFQKHWGPPDHLDGMINKRYESSVTCDPVAAVRGRITGCTRESLLAQVEAIHQAGLKETLGCDESNIFARNVKSFNRLRSCLQEPESCPDEAFQVILATEYHFLMVAYDTPFGVASGEVIWMRGQIRAIENAGYTFLVAKGYKQFLKLYPLMPDLVKVILTNDEIAMTCQLDPHCAKDMRPTLSQFPELRQSIINESFPTWKPIESDRTSQQWIYSSSEISAIPSNLKSHVPMWKVFAVNVWGTRPGDWWWDIPKPTNFSYNSLGPQWTISPFSYPGHTEMPFSIDHQCLKVPLAPEGKLNRIYVYGKDIAYFYNTDEAPSYDLWPHIAKETGMEIVCSVTKRKEDKKVVPDGIKQLPNVDPIGFQMELGKSKVVLGIGSPNISPSPYDALCQGTPVLIPTYGDYPEDRWDLYKKYSQHYPAIQLGEPYVYAYNASDINDLISTLKKAANHPIPRYIPPEQKQANLEERWKWFMSMDWEGLAMHREATLGNEYHLHQAYVIARCFELGRCVPLSTR